VVAAGRNPTVLWVLEFRVAGQLLWLLLGRPWAVCASLGLLTNVDDVAVPTGA